VIVSDSYDAESQANASALVTHSGNLEDNIKQLSDILVSLQSTDYHEMIKIISLISYQSLVLENIITPIGSGCPLCSGHGSCVDGVCICDSGWVLQNCSMSKATLQELITTKLNVIDKLQDLYVTAQSDELTDFILKSLQQITINPEFNNEQTMTKVKETLDEMIKVETVLTRTQREVFAQTVDNIIEYAEIGTL